MNIPQPKETGHIPAEQGMQGKVEPKSGKTEAVEETKETKETKKRQLCGIEFQEKDLELKDFTCTLKLNEKLSYAQRYIVGNMFVEFANITSPDEVREKNMLPNWPLEHPWYSEGHVPMQEKRNFRFKALLTIFRDHIWRFEQFKDFEGSIGTIDFVSLLSDHVETFNLERPKTEQK